VLITEPRDAALPGLSVEIKVDVTDPAPSSGIKEVRFLWRYCPSGVCQPPNLLATDTTPPYSAVWVFPSCGSMPEDRYRVFVEGEDNCTNVGNAVPMDVRLIGRPCTRSLARPGSAATWVSDLKVAGGRGQVVVDGTEAVFPASGVETFTAAARPGTHRFEATLVDGAGRPGAWRFDLSALGAVPGSLRVVAGEPEVAGSAAVVFRLRGKPGERMVFSIDVGAGQ